MSAGAGSMVGDAFGGVGSAGNAMAKAAAGNAMAQGVGVVTGVQDRFNWTAVAASGIGAGVGMLAGQAAQGVGLGRIGQGFAAGVVGGMTTASLGSGEISARQIVINALGYSIVNGIGQPSPSELDLQRQEDMRDAAMFNALERVPALGSGVSVRSDIWGSTASYGGYLPADLSLTAYGTPSLQRIEATPDLPRTELDFDPDHTWNSAGELRGPTNTELPQAGLFDEVRNYWQEKKDSAVAGHNPAQYVGAHVMGVLGGAAEDITNAAKGLYSLAIDRQTQINALTAAQYAISHPDKVGNALINAGQRFIDKPFDEQADSALRFVAGGLATAGTGKAIGIAGDLFYRGSVQSVQWLAPEIDNMAYSYLQRNGLIMNAVPEGENTGFRFADGIAFESDIAAHITRLDGFSQARGIGGAHNVDAFMDAAVKNNVRIVSQTHGDVAGISTIKYQVPAIDRTGNVVLDASGGVVYKNTDFTKTVYDPRGISDRTILYLGQQAASSGYANAVANGLKAYNAEAGGLSFRIYLDPKTGLITNFHPR